MTDLIAERDLLTEELENNLFLTSSGLPNSTSSWAHETPFYVDAQGHLNFGYGIDITSMEPAKDANGNILPIADRFAAAIATFESYLPSSLPEASLDLITNGILAYLNGDISVSTLNSSIPQQDWLGVAAQTMDNYYTSNAIPKLESELSDTDSAYNVNPDNLTAHAKIALEEMQYNSGGGFLLNGDQLLVQALAKNPPDYATAAYELAFDTASPSNTAYSERTLVSAAQILGFDVTIDGDHYISQLTSSSDVNSSTILSFLQQVATNDPSDYLKTDPVVSPAVSFLTNLNSYFLTQGYYVPQPSDGSTAVEIAASVATQVNDAGSITVTGAELQRINAVLPGSSLATGGLVYVPIAATQATPQTFITPAQTGNGQAFVFDPTAGIVYTVAANFASSTVSSDAGKFYIDSVADSSLTFNADTYNSSQYASNTETENVTLIADDPITLGTLSINTETGADSITVSNGMVIALPGITGDETVTDPGATVAPLTVLSDYLGDLGDALSTSALSTLNFNYLNPTGTAYTVSPESTVENEAHTDVTVTYYVTGAPGAVVAGQSTGVGFSGTLPAINVLLASGDLSQDAISNVQTLTVAGNVAVTSAQFNGFSTVNDSSNGSIAVTTGGTDSLANATGTIGLFYATGWDGTTLIGNNDAEQTLEASLFGNDTLIAGSGARDYLIAGEGVDTLIGGAGGDTFVMESWLAAVLLNNMKTASAF